MSQSNVMFNLVTRPLPRTLLGKFTTLPSWISVRLFCSPGAGVESPTSLKEYGQQSMRITAITKSSSSLLNITCDRQTMVTMSEGKWSINMMPLPQLTSNSSMKPNQ